MQSDQNKTHMHVRTHTHTYIHRQTDMHTHRHTHFMIYDGPKHITVYNLLMMVAYNSELTSQHHSPDRQILHTQSHLVSQDTLQETLAKCWHPERILLQQIYNLEIHSLTVHRSLPDLQYHLWPIYHIMILPWQQHTIREYSMPSQGMM